MDLTETELRLVDAVVAGEFLDLTGAVDRSVRADVLRDLLRGTATRPNPPDPHGVRVGAATITGALDLSNLHTEVPLALVACELPEPIRLNQAHLARLVLAGCTVGRIDADGLRCAGPVTFDGMRCTGGISLAYADLGGGLSLAQATVDGGKAEALRADGIKVAGNIALTNGFNATSASSQSTVRLPVARIAGQLRLNNAELTNTGSGAALLADSAHVETSIMLTGMKATANNPGGAVQLVGTRTDTMLFLNQATIENTSGPALEARSVRVGAEIRLGPGFTATGAVNLTGAHVLGALRVAEVTLTGTLDLAEVTVDGPLVLPVGDLAGGMVVDGLTYHRVPVGASVDDWLSLLRHRTPGYAAQPYQQLAAVHRAAGHERDTTRILLAQQRDLGERGQLGGAARLWHRVSGLLLGYGYRPTRPLLGLLATVALACVLVFAAGAGGDTVADDVPCRGTEHLAMAADLSIPLVKLSGQAPCEFVPSAQWFVVGGWLVTVLGWAFATLFVAGFTGLVRKP
jgi:hypothetical protein